MASKNYEVLLKLLLVGDSKSLKTELLRKYAIPEGEFSVDAIGELYHRYINSAMTYTCIVYQSVHSIYGCFNFIATVMLE